MNLNLMQDLLENIKGDILIVDDNEVNLDILLRTLKKQGHNVTAVTNGKDALKIAPRTQPDLILLDIMMPNMDGYDVCRELKMNEITKNIPVIFITAKNAVEDIVKGFQVGGVDYLAKPINRQEICARVKNQLVMRSLISSRGKMIAQLESSNKKLIEADKLKNKFLGMAAHDLRNPLSTIRGFSEILKKESTLSENKDAQEFLSIIHESSEYLLEIVNDLLDYSMIESGNLDLQLKNNSIKDIVENRIKLNQFIAERKNIHIHKSISEVPEIIFDDRRIGQVLDNLLSNAIKFSSSGASVSVEVGTADQNVEVIVKDEGIGISTEDQKKLFHSFPKLSSRPTGGEKSTGLGLAIVEKIVAAHGGFLKVQSELGQGSIFKFYLPLKE
ncbi:MAG: hybrid sensor histidine kinase/response regulator [Nitrospina sp.]|nr:hybrid sensor histidine kinase/response regulator [Nitrospina sp.]